MTYLYRGVVIFRNASPGFALRYTARTNAGDPLAADTLAGMRRMIRDKESDHE